MMKYQVHIWGLMLTILVTKKDSQTMNNISKLSVTTINKISSKNQKIKQKHLSHSESVLANLIQSSPYPNFRFFCPYCSSLDVFITIDKTSNHFTVDCLDCEKKWIDSRSWKT
jgi:hypothetical protein